MSRSRYNVGQSPPEYEGRFPSDPRAFYPVQSAAAGTDENTVLSPPMGLESSPYRLDNYDVSMQHSELEAAPLNLDNDAWLNQGQELESQSYSPNTWMAQTQRIELDSHPYGVNNLISSERRPELESSPISQRSELQGNQLWTEGGNETPELHSNEPVHQQLLQQPHVASPYKYLSARNGFQPVSSWAPTLPPEVIARSSIANSPLDYSSPAQHYEPPFPPVDSVPTRLTPARHEGLSNTFGFNNTPARQSTSFGQSSCQTSPFLDRSFQTGHGQARAMAKMESVEGQSIRKTVGRHNFPQPDPSAEYSDAVTRASPRYRDEALLRTMATDNSITSIPYLSKEPLPALRSKDHLVADHTPERPNQIVYLASLESQGPLEKHNHQQQIYSISPLAASDTTLGASSSIVSTVSSNGARGAYSNHGQTLPITPNESPTTPGSSSLSDRTSAKPSVSSSTTGKTSIEGSRVTSPEQCPKCPRKLNGRDRKQNLKRHLEFTCRARAGPRKDFKCPTKGCNKRYNRPDNLAAHCRKKH
ncbi:MAG: hypothetical protein LQ349_005914 [Xanthoria aureola]|nr:MAG: hypothetical protein LQ349_005914 [Xanthoria aureola]